MVFGKIWMKLQTSAVVYAIQNKQLLIKLSINCHTLPLEEILNTNQSLSMLNTTVDTLNSILTISSVLWKSKPLTNGSRKTIREPSLLKEVHMLVLVNSVPNGSVITLPEQTTWVNQFLVLCQWECSEFPSLALIFVALGVTPIQNSVPDGIGSVHSNHSHVTTTDTDMHHKNHTCSTPLNTHQVSCTQTSWEMLS